VISDGSTSAIVRPEGLCPALDGLCPPVLGTVPGPLCQRSCRTFCTENISGATWRGRCGHSRPANTAYSACRGQEPLTAFEASMWEAACTASLPACRAGRQGACRGGREGPLGRLMGAPAGTSATSTPPRPATLAVVPPPAPWSTALPRRGPSIRARGPMLPCLRTPGQNCAVQREDGQVRATPPTIHSVSGVVLDTRRPIHGCTTCPLQQVSKRRVHFCL
jgi:hypothetical protein